MTIPMPGVGAVLLLLLLLLGVRQLAASGSAGVGEEARAWVDDGATLLDVRTPAEFASGHLRGAVNIPVDQVQARVDELGDRVVVYCRSGARAGRAAQALRGAGREVLQLGTMAAWGDPGAIVR
jgi:rhodanese-related sulfurtransferase